jgi:hypothetical protein
MVGLILRCHARIGPTGEISILLSASSITTSTDPVGDKTVKQRVVRNASHFLTKVPRKCPTVFKLNLFLLSYEVFNRKNNPFVDLLQAHA